MVIKIVFILLGLLAYAFSAYTGFRLVRMLKSKENAEKTVEEITPELNKLLNTFTVAVFAALGLTAAVTLLFG